MTKFSIFKVVYYDGTDAFVSEVVAMSEDGEITAEAETRVEDYFSKATVEVLKIEYSRPALFDEIAHDMKLLATFESMYF